MIARISPLEPFFKIVIACLFKIVILSLFTIVLSHVFKIVPTTLQTTLVANLLGQILAGHAKYLLAV
jgi:hypothetical protein